MNALNASHRFGLLINAFAIALLHLCAVCSIALADVESKSENQTTLSVAPLNHAEYPSDRPHWIDQSPEIADDESSIVAASGISDTPEEAADTLAVMKRAAVETMLRHRLGRRGQPIDLDHLQIDDQWIEESLVVRRYDGSVDVGGESKYESAVLLRLSDEARTMIDASIRESQVGERLGVMGLSAIGALALLLGGSIVMGGVANRQQRTSKMSDQ
ncbi:MAG: hypothetical protein AAF539_02955 [Planctomycetota bacterium]